MPELLTLTIVLGLASTAVASFFSRSLVTPAILYWGGWIAGVGAAESMSGDGVFPPFTDAGRELVLQAHIGAAIGFVLGAFLHWLVVESQRPYAQPLPRLRRELRVSSRLVYGLLVVQLVLGVYFLQSMLRDIVAGGGIAHLMDIRAMYLQRAHMVTIMDPVTRVASHLNLLLLVFPFLFGTEDGLDGRIRWKRLLLWWLAGVPAGLGTGGRAWIVNVPLIYSMSYVIATGAWLSPPVRRLMLRGSVALMGMIALFGLVDRVRSADYETTSVIALMSDDGRWYDEFKPIKPVVFYAGIPTLAIESFADYAAGVDRYGGVLVMPFWGAQLERMGLVEASALEYFRESRRAVQQGPDPLLGWTHATIIPLLVGDFGRSVLMVSMALFAFLVQYGFLLLREGGIMARFLAVQFALYGGFWMFQDSMLGTAAPVLPALWLALLLFIDRFAYGAGFIASPLVVLRPAPAPGAYSSEQIR